jgi:hypothetical protein
MLILSATSGNNLKLAHTFEAEVIAQGRSAEAIALPSLQLPLYDSLNQDSGAGDAGPQAPPGPDSLRTGVQRVYSPGAE